MLLRSGKKRPALPEHEIAKRAKPSAPEDDEIYEISSSESVNVTDNDSDGTDEPEDDRADGTDDETDEEPDESAVPPLDDVVDLELYEDAEDRADETDEEPDESAVPPLDDVVDLELYEDAEDGADGTDDETDEEVYEERREFTFKHDQIVFGEEINLPNAVGVICAACQFQIVEEGPATTKNPAAIVYPSGMSIVNWGHIMHEKCLHKWFEQGKNSCFTCRQPITSYKSRITSDSEYCVTDVIEILNISDSNASDNDDDGDDSFVDEVNDYIERRREEYRIRALRRNEL